MHNDALFVGISGVRGTSALFDFGHGITLSETYAHLMAPFMVAFAKPEKPGQPHPPPWAAASGGLGFDISFQLTIRERQDSDLPLTGNSLAWWIIALLRLRVGPRLIAPAIANAAFSKEAAASSTFRIHPLETPTRLLNIDPDAPVDLTSSDLEWAKSWLVSSSHLLTKSPEFSLLAESVDQSAFAHRPELALLMLWAALEEVFSPSKTELRYRVSSLIASFLEPAGRERLARQKAIAKLYDSRSAAAHGRATESPSPLWETYALARQVVVKIIEDNHVPSKHELEERMFGAGPE